MKNYYITFGSDSQFPYPDGYVIIKAESNEQAREIFKAHFPNRPGSECLNFSFMYEEDRWNELKTQFYKDKEPCEVIGG